MIRTRRKRPPRDYRDFISCDGGKKFHFFVKKPITRLAAWQSGVTVRADGGNETIEQLLEAAVKIQQTLHRLRSKG